QTPGQYLREASFERLTARGHQLAAQYREPLARIEKEFGVPGNIVLAIWARETDYGGYQLPLDAVRTLATQAYTGKRKDFFRNEFLHALKMLQDGVPRSDMRSSWGGAVGVRQICRRFRRRRQGRHLAFRAGRVGLGGKAARRQGVGEGGALGDRSP